MGGGSAFEQRFQRRRNNTLLYAAEKGPGRGIRGRSFADVREPSVTHGGEVQLAPGARCRHMELGEGGGRHGVPWPAGAPGTGPVSIWGSGPSPRPRPRAEESSSGGTRPTGPSPPRPSPPPCTLVLGHQGGQQGPATHQQRRGVSRADAVRSRAAVGRARSAPGAGRRLPAAGARPGARPGA